MTGAGVVYLMYHELEVQGRTPVNSDPGYLRYVVPARVFESQMQWLHSIGWRGMSVSEGLSPEHGAGVVLTFDDGCETDLSVAAPLLKQLRFGATFYVTVGHIGKAGYLSAAQIRELCQLGFEVGCHSMTHAYLAGLPASRLSDEIALAKDRLQQIAGQHVDHFSCPGGRCDGRVVQVAEDCGYLSVATSRIAINGRSADPFRLGRIAVMRDTDLGRFQRLCRGRGLWRLQFAEMTRNIAKRTLGDTQYDRVRSAILNR